MPRLTLRLLGTFYATLSGEPVTRFESAKTQALLAFLVLEPDQPHRGMKLASLLWPNKPDATARSNLRHALSSLRGTIGDRAPSTPAASPLLLATRETVQFSSAGDCWVDVLAFRGLVSEGNDRGSVRSLEEAVSLYRGGLLEGFTIRDSPVFEDWLLLTADRLERQVALALQSLVAETARRGNYTAARRHAWRWVELQPWQETAHQRLMQVLAASGRRTEALAQYASCRRILREEFDVEPSSATLQVYERIRDGHDVIGTPVQTAPVPSLRGAGGPARAEANLEGFVARERELSQLRQHLDAAREGRGHVAFVTGEAGSGKTSLLQAFIRAAQIAHPELVALGGSCSAYTGVGDPYLPFRTILSQAVGGGWSGGAAPSRVTTPRIAPSRCRP